MKFDHKIQLLRDAAFENNVAVSEGISDAIQACIHREKTHNDEFRRYMEKKLNNIKKNQLAMEAIHKEIARYEELQDDEPLPPIFD